ncbi:MAG: helix-turn-helix domain-containing protein [Candidatus Dormibacteraceae bacterium]
MAEVGSPLVQRRRLRTELKKARQTSGLTQDQVAGEMDWSMSKIIRIEAGSSGISANDLKALLQLYGVKDPGQVDSLLALARVARERSWWSSYRDVAPQPLLQLIEYESAAQVIRQFENEFVPGILQTEDYAHAVLDNYYEEELGVDQLRALVDLRTRRQDLIDAENPPSFHFVLDEAVVRRLVVGPSVMRRQLRRLIEVAGKPNVTLELIPFSVGLHPGMKGPFEIIEFADPSVSDTVYLESPRGDIFSDAPEETSKYIEAFDKLKKASLGSQGSLARIAKIADEMS